MKRTASLLFAFLLCLCQTFGQTADTAKTHTTPAAADDESIPYQHVLNEEMDEMLDYYNAGHETGNDAEANQPSPLTEEEKQDSLYRLRLEKIPSELNIKYHSAVRSYINLYVNTRKRSSATFLGLSQYYFPKMKAIFRSYGVPEDLVYLTIIESSLNPTAVSPAGATGIWQFMFATGKSYGLHNNSFVDDRRDPFMATDAAARHLRDLYKMFGDWGIAISAYNCGAGNAKKAIARSGGKSTFWGIRPYLPRETQNYYPAFVGVYYMMHYYHAHDITPAKLSIPTDVDTIMVSKEVHFGQIAEVLGIDIKEIKTLNPQYKRNVVPAFEKQYPLRLRVHDLRRFKQMQDSIHNYQYDTYFAPLQSYISTFTGKPPTGNKVTKKYHVVKSGENLAKIANKYGISVDELKKMNHLKSNYIQTGQKLVVGYVTTNSSSSTSSSSNGSKPSSPTTTTKPSTSNSSSATSGNYTIHVVKSGETLYTIANKYHTTISKIMAINSNIKKANNIIVGQKIKIPQ